MPWRPQRCIDTKAAVNSSRSTSKAFMGKLAATVGRSRIISAAAGNSTCTNFPRTEHVYSNGSPSARVAGHQGSAQTVATHGFTECGRRFHRIAGRDFFTIVLVVTIRTVSCFIVDFRAWHIFTIGWQGQERGLEAPCGEIRTSSCQWHAADVRRVRCQALPK
jgi:hypothetical protein